MARAMDATSQWYNTFEKVLECPVCLEVRQCTIVQCATGHHICEFCKDKIPNCPLCHARILETRNFLAEGVANKFEDIKLLIENEIENIKLDGKKESTSTFTQTDFEFPVFKSKSSSAIQTGEVARPKRENLRAKGTALSIPFYPCHIGSCMFKSSYRGLLQHLADYHKDIFYEVHESRGQFTETCAITTSAVPQSYDFAFLKNETVDLFHYDLAINNGGIQLTRHGKVISCGGSRAMVCSNSIWINNEKLFKNTRSRLVEVRITVRRCLCKQFTNNVAVVNP